MENRERLFRYLLGELPPDEQARLQKDAAADRALREDLREAESDLIDSYVCQRLSEVQCNRFETWFLDSAEKRERVEMAQILLSSAVRRMAPIEDTREVSPDAVTADIRIKPPWRNWFISPRLAWVMATLLFGGATILAFQNLRLRYELEHSASVEAHSRNQVAELKNQISELRKPDRVATSGPGEISLFLSPGQQRGGADANEPALLKLPSFPMVVLSLELEQDRYPQYEVSVTTAGGKEVWRKQSLKSQLGSRGERVIVARLPSELLAPGDYFVRVSAGTSAGEQRSLDAYAFTVTR